MQFCRQILFGVLPTKAARVERVEVCLGVDVTITRDPQQLGKLVPRFP